MIVRKEYTLLFVVALTITAVTRTPSIIYTQTPFNPATKLSRPISTLRRIFGLRAIITPALHSHADLGRHPVRARSLVPFAQPPPQHVANVRWSERTIDVCVIGKFVPRKQHLETVSALKEVAMILGRPLSVLIVGEMVPGHSDDLIQQIEAYGKEAAPHLHIDIEKDLAWIDTQRRLQHSKVFVLNSIREPASVSQLEAMANGAIPFINPDNGTAHYILPESTGFLAASRKALVRNLVEVFSHPSKGVEMSLACQKSYREDFDLRAVGDRWSNTLAMTRIAQPNEAAE